MKIKLIATGSRQNPSEVFSLPLPAVIGRGSHADLRLDDPWVSRVQCELAELDGLIVVRDLGSKHGTFVNGAAVTESRLESGDELGVGLSSFAVEFPVAESPIDLAAELSAAN